MGAAFSSTTRQCGVCYFELPKGSKPVKRHVRRRFLWRLDRVPAATEAHEPFDAPLKHTTLKKSQYATVVLVTDWDGLQESVSRGCRGCQAITQLLFAAAADDDVVLDEKSKIVFEWIGGWKGGFSRLSQNGSFNRRGLLELRMKVRSASPRETPYDALIPLGSSDFKVEDDDSGAEDPLSSIWTFRFDVDRLDDEKDRRRSHPFAYEASVAFGDTGSERSLQQVNDWVKECISTHELCGEEQTRLPDRVLEITTVADGKPPRVRLVENVGIEAPYVCLSHRWGPSTPSCRTLKSNLVEQKKNIEWSKLLKTFQDAALVTARLGLKYVWIDSLCIIQDSVDDWKAQAAQMCDIYRGAYVTVAASCSDDSTQGLFRKSSCCRTVKPQHQGPSYVVRRIPEHPTWDWVGIQQMKPELPLLTRSWVYQERLLSSRIAHFTRYEIMFECSRPGEGPSYCECHNATGGAWGGAAGGYGASDDDMTKLRKLHHAEALRASAATAAASSSGDSGGSDNIDVVRKYWQKVLHEYSGYHITSTSDKLPALAGIARQYGTAHPELGDYVAGMWERTLVHDLMWFCPKGDPNVRAMHLWRPPHIPQPESGSFPTWSWIAAGQHVTTKSACPRVRPEDLRVVAYDFELSGPDEYGAIRNASLELEGFMAAGRLVLFDISELGTGLVGDWPGFQGPRGGPYDIYADYAFFKSSPDEPNPDMLEIGMEIFCMRTGFAWGGKYLSLVLRRVSEEDGTGIFERIGMITNAPRDWMDAIFSDTTSKTKIKII
ncbi:hypothetical protein N8I77_011684 [Diaporthe amygdali]|uniref:Heterokaryon incompatibility domain-containing protein n=1 Tax=Phomopsis amygdali TaxID=1214568 RepID=A0AAD9VXQ7_PHOAM|nr:hypothetical protein N8I77_011684 [Diaporthe amygdali]